MAVRLTRLLGFTTRQAFLQVVEAQSDTYAKLSIPACRLVNLAEAQLRTRNTDLLPGGQSPVRSLRGFIAFFQACASAALRRPRSELTCITENLNAYISGELLLFPPVNVGVSAELISFCRHLTLSLLEANREAFVHALAQERLAYLASFRALEHSVLLLTLERLNLFLPGLTLLD
jgi:hypothetical protein